MKKKLSKSISIELKEMNPQLPDVVNTFFEISDNLQKKYPQLSEEAAEGLTSSLINEVAKNIKLGNHIAFIQPKKSGDLELTVYGFEAFTNTSEHVEEEVKFQKLDKNK